MADEVFSVRMAAVARELEHQSDPQQTLETAVRIAVSDIAGADSAGVSIGHRKGHVETPAAVGSMARRGDELQYETGEGPCLDAIWEEPTTYCADLTSDSRWPAWGPRVVEETGAHSILSFRLFTHENIIGALNLYSGDVDGFDEADRDEGSALAAHVAVALAAAQEISSLGHAIDSRTLIGQAVGIVMERFSMKGPEAFALLSRLSQTSNVKLRLVAADVVSGVGTVTKDDGCLSPPP